jgi:uncharacterized protein (DUF58 family)
MNAWLGWALAVLAVAAGYTGWGWPGVALAVTVIVFWLLLQFGRLLRAMRQAGGAPVGHVASAVMLHARLRQGMRLMDIIPLTRSLGQRLDDAGSPAAPESRNKAAASEGPVEHFGWVDGSGARVRITLVNGRLTTWSLERPVEGHHVAGPTQPAA